MRWSWLLPMVLLQVSQAQQPSAPSTAPPSTSPPASPAPTSGSGTMSFSSGGIYTWIDANGQLHITDRLEDVPAKQRAASEERSNQGVLPGSGKGTYNRMTNDGSAPAPSPAQPSPGGTSNPEQAQQKAQWQGRLQSYQKQSEDASRRIVELEAELLHLRNILPPGHFEEVEVIQAKLEQERARKAEADEMLDGGLADEARKAGVPPGWVR